MCVSVELCFERSLRRRAGAGMAWRSTRRHTDDWLMGG